MPPRQRSAGQRGHVAVRQHILLGVKPHTSHLFGAALQFCLHFLQEFLPHSFGFCGVLDCSHSYRFSVGILDEWTQTVSMPLLFPWV